MGVRCRRCNSDRVSLKDSKFSFDDTKSNVCKKFFCIECGYEFEVLE